MDLMRLPFDISCLIFSQLNQKDIIQCMHVSRQWLNHVPSYSHKLFQQIAISLDESENPNEYLLSFLGPHITRLLLAEEGIRVHDVLKRFRVYNITSLEILHYNPLDDYYDDDGSRVIPYDPDEIQTTVSPLLIELRDHYKHLTHLKLIHYSGYVITLFDIMESCPELTHLTLSTRQSGEDSIDSCSMDGDEQEPTYFNDRDMDGDGNGITRYGSITHLKQQMKRYGTRTYPHLIYLHIDHGFDFDLAVLPFVRKCPALAHIRFSIFDEDGFNFVKGEDAATHMGRLLDVAPNLYSFTLSNLLRDSTLPTELLTHSTMVDYDAAPPSRTITTTEEHEEEEEEEEGGGGGGGGGGGNLHAFVLDQDGARVDGPLSVLFKKSSQTLTVLDIKLDMFDFYRISNDNVPLSNVYFPCLSILRLACLDLDPDWIAGLLRQCPVLEEIMLWEIPDHVTQAMVDAPCLAAGSNYCRLRRFHLTIYLSGITADRPEHPLDLTRWITSAPRLEYVVLWNTYPTNHMLYCISQIPSLKKFGTNHRGFQDSLVTTQGLLAFATGLSSSSIMKKQAVSQLQELRLEAFKPLTDSVMKALAGIDRLKDLHICRCPFITDEGIKLFLDNKKPGSLEKLSLSYCRRVTNSGIDYAISILGASKVSFIHRWHPTNT